MRVHIDRGTLKSLASPEQAQTSVPGDQLRTRARPNATDAEYVETTRSDDSDTPMAHRKRVMSG